MGDDVVRDELGGMTVWERLIADARADAEADAAGEIAAELRAMRARLVVTRAVTDAHPALVALGFVVPAELAGTIVRELEEAGLL